MKLLIFPIIPLLPIPGSTSVYSDDLQVGVAAYVKKDNKAAFEKIDSVAQQGSASAQHNPGVMYVNARGVRQDYVQAHKRLDLAVSSSPLGEERNQARKNRAIREENDSDPSGENSETRPKTLPERETQTK